MNLGINQGSWAEDPCHGLAYLVGAHLLEGLGQIAQLKFQKGADRAAKRNLFGLGNGIAIRFGAWRAPRYSIGRSER